MNLDTGVTYVTMSKSNGLPLHCRRCCDANLGDTTLRCPYGVPLLDLWDCRTAVIIRRG